MPDSHSSMSPTITAMIRLDHMHVLTAFHRYHADTAWWRKRAIVNSVCAALEIHAQLEEEIFYPALRGVLSGDQTLDKSRPEHDESGFSSPMSGMLLRSQAHFGARKRKP